MLNKKASQMTRANSEALGQVLNPAVLQVTFSNQPQRSRHCSWCSRPCRCSRRALRAATEARAKARRGSGCCGFKITNILVGDCRNRAAWATINLCAEDTYEELPVEPRISSKSCPPPCAPLRISHLERHNI